MEFLRLLCNLYIIALTVVLPLYTGGTYRQLGDNKYILFRNLSLLCLGLWMAASMTEVIRRRKESGGAPGDRVKLRKMSAVDICVLLYGVSVLFSALFSKYGNTAWLGYTEWYMGVVSQLMFVGIYFFVSRCYDGKKYPVYFWTAAFFIVVLLGILHRFGLDPLGLMKEFNSGDWEYSHMLSTIGNINWFCGYCSVALAVPLGKYLRAGSRWKCVLLYLVSAAGLFLLFIQGSDMGVAIMAAGLFICLLWGIKDGVVFRRTFALIGTVCFLIPSYGLLASFLGQEVIKALPPDSIGWNVINLPVWWPAGALCMILWIMFCRLSGCAEEKVQRYARIAIVGALFLAAAAGGLIFLIRRPMDEMWGSGRGTIWNLAFQGFLKNGWPQKLIGVGPDCFAEYIYTVFTWEELSFMTGRWANAVFANAHNEWLNHLVNLGIMGTGCYLGIFVSGIKRYRRYLPGILAVVMYGVASLVGFQQCMSTPLLFLILGMCEGSFEGEKRYEMGEI